MSPENQALMLSFVQAREGASMIELIQSACSAKTASCAAALSRMVDKGFLEEGADDTSILAMLADYPGNGSRRRLLAYMRHHKVMRRDVPIIKAMVPGSAPSVMSITAAVAGTLNKTAQDILKDNSSTDNMMARFESAWISVRLFEHPLTEAAEAIGKSHTTILNNMSKVDIRISRSPALLKNLLDMADVADSDAALRHAQMCVEPIKSAGQRTQ